MGLLFESLLYDLLLLLTTLIALTWAYAQLILYRYFDKRGIPYIQPTFPLGNSWTMFLMKESPGTFFHRLYREGEGHPMIGFFSVFNPALLIRDPALIQQIAVKDFSHFQDHSLPLDEEINPLEGHLFNVTGAKWRALRYKLAPTFTSGKLKWMFGIMEQVSDNLVKQTAKESDVEVEVKELMSRYTTDVIASCAFGIEAGSLENPDSEVRKLGRFLFHPPFYWILKMIFRFTFSKLAVWLKMKNTPDFVDDFFFSLMRQAFAHRKETGTKRNDFVQLLMELKEKGEVKLEPKEINEQEDEYLRPTQVAPEDIDKLVITDAILAAQTFVFFVAGFETSASAMSFTLYHLALHPDVQTKLRKEVLEVKDRFKCINYDSLKEMHFLHSCIMESVRIYPPVPVVNRECTKDYTFPDGSSIKPGYAVAFPVMGLHHDPQYWPEPEKFKPERFMPGETVVPGTFLPFGEGPRVCIGQRFALLELKLGLAKLLENFEVLPTERLQVPLILDKVNFITMPSDGIWLKFRRLANHI